MARLFRQSGETKGGGSKRKTQHRQTLARNKFCKVLEPVWRASVSACQHCQIQRPRREGRTNMGSFRRNIVSECCYGTLFGTILIGKSHKPFGMLFWPISAHLPDILQNNCHLPKSIKTLCSNMGVPSSRFSAASTR